MEPDLSSRRGVLVLRGSDGSGVGDGSLGDLDVPGVQAMTAPGVYRGKLGPVTRIFLETGVMVRIERIEGVVVVTGLPSSLYGYQVATIFEECEALRGGR